MWQNREDRAPATIESAREPAWEGLAPRHAQEKHRQALKIDSSRGQIGLDGHVPEPTTNGASQSVLGLGLAVQALDPEAVAAIGRPVLGQPAAVAGLGLILVPKWLVGIEIRHGLLREVLPEFEAVPEASPLYAVYPHQRHLPRKVRAFIDFLAERFAGEIEWDGRQ